MVDTPPFFQRIIDAPAYYESVLGGVHSKQDLERHIQQAEKDVRMTLSMTDGAGAMLIIAVLPATIGYCAIYLPTLLRPKIMVHPFQTPESCLFSLVLATTFVFGSALAYDLASWYSTRAYAEEGKKKLKYWQSE